MRLKRTTADALFSNYIRLRDKYDCQRCGKHIDPPTAKIQCSHLYGRGNYAVRFDEDNAVALCGSVGVFFASGCHAYLESNPVAHRDFFFNRLGQEKFDALVRRANGLMKDNWPSKKELEKAMREKYRTLIKEIKAKGPVIFGAH